MAGIEALIYEWNRALDGNIRGRGGRPKSYHVWYMPNLLGMAEGLLPRKMSENPGSQLAAENLARAYNSVEDERNLSQFGKFEVHDA